MATLTSQLAELHSRIATIQSEISVAIEVESAAQADWVELLSMNQQVRALFDQEKVIRSKLLQGRVPAVTRAPRVHTTQPKPIQSTRAPTLAANDPVYLDRAKGILARHRPQHAHKKVRRRGAQVLKRLAPRAEAEANKEIRASNNLRHPRPNVPSPRHKESGTAGEGSNGHPSSSENRLLQAAPAEAETESRADKITAEAAKEGGAEGIAAQVEQDAKSLTEAAAEEVEEEAESHREATEEEAAEVVAADMVETTEEEEEEAIEVIEAVAAEVEEAAGGEAAGTLDRLYQVGGELGTGAFAVVHRAVLRKGLPPRTQEGGAAIPAQVAIKTIDRRNLDQEDMSDLDREVQVLRAVHHPHCVGLFEVFDEPPLLHLVMELVPGGELFDLIKAQAPFAERLASQVVSQLADALEHLHSAVRVIHRDIKPENVLCCAERKTFKLTDFGTAVHIPQSGEPMDEVIGTPGYVAPEVVLGTEYGTAVDLWSLGVVLYMLFSKSQPFEHSTLDDAYPQNLTVPFEEPVWSTVHPQLKVLLVTLLQEDPNQRCTAQQLQQDLWVLSHAS
eukprot:TRINITY_DN17163_c0_g1_i1.p1 TRINITY_DN17163_c0_g1~~TRINITY_DN17163_c0_g1_i1.p1  ORF type:complete len:562 (+),score=153.99 TRINITY_DN17163_c0_g1_i1:172-1857(+)